MMNKENFPLIEQKTFLGNISTLMVEMLPLYHHGLHKNLF